LLSDLFQHSEAQLRWVRLDHPDTELFEGRMVLISLIIFSHSAFTSGDREQRSFVGLMEEDA